jgi:hypothetical protein
VSETETALAALDRARSHIDRSRVVRDIDPYLANALIGAARSWLAELDLMLLELTVQPDDG